MGLMFQIISLVWIRYLGFSEKSEFIAIVTSQICIVLTTVTYLTGQAKIDIEARANYGANKECDNKSSKY